MRLFPAFLMAAASVSAAPAQSPSLVKDIVAQTPTPVRGHLSTNFAFSSGGVAFVANTLESGRELWFSDGTDKGTRLLIDFCPGQCDVFRHSFLFSSNDSVLLSGGFVNDLASGSQFGGLWMTDGTLKGTNSVSQLCDDKNECPPLGLWSFRERTVLVNRKGAVWITDGSTRGTHLLAELEFSFDVAAAELGGICSSGLGAHSWRPTARQREPTRSLRDWEGRRVRVRVLSKSLARWDSSWRFRKKRG